MNTQWEEDEFHKTNIRSLLDTDDGHFYVRLEDVKKTLRERFISKERVREEIAKEKRCWGAKDHAIHIAFSDLSSRLGLDTK